MPSTLRSPFALVVLGTLAACSSDPPATTSGDEVVATAHPCEGLTADGLSERARSFMAEQSMIRSGEEQELPFLGMHTR